MDLVQYDMAVRDTFGNATATLPAPPTPGNRLVVVALVDTLPYNMPARMTLPTGWDASDYDTGTITLDFGPGSFTSDQGKYLVACETAVGTETTAVLQQTVVGSNAYIFFGEYQTASVVTTQTIVPAEPDFVFDFAEPDYQCSDLGTPGAGYTGAIVIHTLADFDVEHLSGVGLNNDNAVSLDWEVAREYEGAAFTRGWIFDVSAYQYNGVSAVPRCDFVGGGWSSAVMGGSFLVPVNNPEVVPDTPADVESGGLIYVRRHTSARALPYELSTGSLQGVPWHEIGE